MILAINYFLLPTLITLIVATIGIGLVTKAVNYPNASFTNAFFLVIGWMSLVFLQGIFFHPNFLFSWVLVFVLFFFLIRTIYQAPYLRVFILFSLFTIFRTVIALVVIPALTDRASGFLF